MEINFFNEDVEFPEIDTNSLISWINSVISSYSKDAGSINYIFCSDEYLLKVNQEYLNHDYFTDIITFNYCEEKTISGDIFISLDTVKSNAREYDTIDTEIYRVMIHGVLHLIGLNDHLDEEKAKMRAAEDKALNLLKE